LSRGLKEGIVSQNDRFGDGLAVGVIVGSVVGAVIGVLVANRVATSPEALPTQDPEQALGDAKRSLEEKITQLNEAIESAREKLATVPAAGDKP
jgi:uncharacterized membrane-anchored protein YhcB (DUF1043 family)